ncbi:MAG: hypothetical protein SFZ24_13035 [Planctomycetota bacterium]|nr:hypothetical protein [Planctomycetota bacterium]
MMQVYLDGKLLSGAGQSLSAALESALDAAGADRLLIEAVADGVPVPAEHLDEPPASEPYAGRLEFTSADASGLARATLSDAAGALVDLKPLHELAADRVREGRIPEAMALISDVLIRWGEVRSAIELTSRTAGAAGYDEAGSRELSEVIRDLASRLTEIKRALGAQDWSSLSDVLAYDMDEQADRLRNWLDRASTG